MSERNILLYLTDIHDSINKINDFAQGMTFQAFSSDARTIDAIVRNIEIIGEAARHIPNHIQLSYPTVPWKQIIGSRAKVVHEYFGVDLEIIWQTIQEDLPKLKKEVHRIIHDQQSQV